MFVKREGKPHTIICAYCGKKHTYTRHTSKRILCDDPECAKNYYKRKRMNEIKDEFKGIKKPNRHE